MSIFDKLESKLTSIPPKRRRRIAVHFLVWSFVAMIGNVVLYLTKIVDQASLILVTLVLSWFAITLTAADLVATTDVREESTD